MTPSDTESIDVKNSASVSPASNAFFDMTAMPTTEVDCETVSAAVRLDPLTRTVIDPDGNRIPVEHLTFHIGMSQPDPQSVRLSGVTPVRLSV